ncbi:hypothetical protein [Vibrio owensii]|uniref:hypothetical protein n=1 Tax=Vibrio owensii TaxID=696485 RepID=UPI0038CD23A2
MNQDAKKQLGSHRRKATLSFWKVVGFAFLPIVIGYQSYGVDTLPTPLKSFGQMVFITTHCLLS